MKVIGSKIKIESIKHDQSLHRLWEENTVLYADDNRVIGFNCQTNVREGAGKSWVTTTPALFYFDRREWFNVIYLLKETKPFYYCNICSPFIYQNNKIQYIDYDLDFIVQLDYSYHIVDVDEYKENVTKYHYPKDVQRHILEAKKMLRHKINTRENPFNQQFLNEWLTKMNKNY